MKRDKRTIDEILRQYLPSASQEEVQSAGEAVLLRLHEELQHGIEQFKYPEPEVTLGPYEQLALAAVSLLRGQASSYTALQKAGELAGRDVPVFSFGLAFRRLEKLDLIQTSVETLPSDGRQERVRITPRGERALAAAGVIVEECAPGHLADLI
jgi:hypothetical protein